LSLLLDALKEAEKSRKGLEATAETNSPTKNEDICLDLDLDQLEPKNVDTDTLKSETTESKIKKSKTTELKQSAPQERATPEKPSKQQLQESTLEKEEKSPVPATRPQSENRPRIAANVFQNQTPTSPQPETKEKSRVLLLLLLLLLVLTGLVVMYFVLSAEPESAFPQHRYNTQNETSAPAQEINLLSEGASTLATPKDTASTTINGTQLSPNLSDRASLNEATAVLTNATENSQHTQLSNNQSNSPVFAPPAFNQAITNLSVASQNQETTNTSNSTSKPNTTAEPKPGIQISKRKLSARSQSSLTAAQQALETGNLTSAEAAYRQAIKISPENTTATSALASLLAQQGKAQEAQVLFLKTLAKDPENLIAKTGLINIRAMNSANLSAGSELKQLLIEHPKQAHLHASLGNFHARRNEWSTAQVAYFEAFALDSENPDYAFNLAISLDQIGKPDIAINYYKKAIELFGKRPSQFSKSDAERRLSELEVLNKPREPNQLEGTAP